ncbi:MAG: C40 family peptidase [Candidatus Doudnabacteria bacterium]|nr:C40 family peptidase [Candidatus Doudnabacteria bacterium]
MIVKKEDSVFTYYHAVGRRCAVSLSDLKLQIPDEEALLRLELKGFGRVKVDLAELTEFCKQRSEYERGVRIELAPEVVDCSTLTKWLYGQLGIWLPRHTLHQRECGEVVTTLRPWDLVFTEGLKPYFWNNQEDGVGHVGIVLESGMILHAANSKVGVIESTLDEFADQKYRGARRILKPGTVTLESYAGRRAEFSMDYRCYILQTIRDSLIDNKG